VIKRVDAEVAKNQQANLAAFVVLLSDDEGAENKLRALKDSANLKHVALAVDNPAGPPPYKIAKEAQVTVILYRNQTVTANHAFKKGEFTGDAAGKVLADLPKILGNRGS